MILGLIPARGGSKSIARKNLRRLGDSTLLARAIACAFGAAVFDRVVVSTEDAEIKDAAEDCGAQVIDRPEALAADDTPMLTVVYHALGEIPEADIVCLLQPTAPLRRPEHIRRALTMLKDDLSEPTSVVSVTETVSPEWTFTLDARGLLSHPEHRTIRRQDLEPAYVRDGTVYAFHATNLTAYRDIYGPRCLPLIIPRMQSVNIDTEDDFAEAEWKMGRL
jgi:N-acylneuraminate cytidylyltransferase